MWFGMWLSGTVSAWYEWGTEFHSQHNQKIVTNKITNILLKNMKDLKNFDGVHWKKILNISIYLQAT